MKHVTSEDDDIYPVLEKSQASDAVRLGSVMSSLMQSYAVDFIGAIDVVLMSDGPIEEVVMDAYHNAVIDIKNRIKIEEALLFPEYEKVLSTETE